MSASMNFWIVKYVVDEYERKKSRLRGAKMVELDYFKTGCKENLILRKTSLNFINLILEGKFFESPQAIKWKFFSNS